MKYWLCAVLLAVAGCSVTSETPEPDSVRASQQQTRPAAAAGERQFMLCAGCHAMSADAEPMFGPHLQGIVGRRAAALPDFDYSDALRAEQVTWDAQLLDDWLANPDLVAPDMCLPFNGIQDAGKRKALIEYLKASP